MQLVKEQILVESNRVEQNKTVRIDKLHPIDVCVGEGGLHYMVLNEVNADRYVRCWDFDLKAVVMINPSLFVTQVSAKVVVTDMNECSESYEPQQPVVKPEKPPMVDLCTEGSLEQLSMMNDRELQKFFR